MTKKTSDLENRLSLDSLTFDRPIVANEDEERMPFVFENPSSSYSESFKILRTNLKFTMHLSEPRSLVVTSPMTAEGKTTVACNIASSFAQSGMRVVVVGADIRIPSVYKEFGIENEVGLSNYLNHEVDLPFITHVYKHEARLKIITSGPIPPNSADLLSSERLLEGIEELKRENDLVVFDTPPVNLVADTLVIGPLVDGVLVVVNKGLSRKKDLKVCLERMRFSNVVGIVINASTEKSDHSYSYRGSNYGYGDSYHRYGQYSHYKKNSYQ